MKKFFLLFFCVFICQKQLTAQVIEPAENYKITITRNDTYTSGIGYADTTVKLDLKINATEKSNSFSPGIISSKSYVYPLTSLYPINPFPTIYAKVTFSDPVIPVLFSGYYPLSTVVGSHTLISDPNMIVYDPYPGQYGYGVDLYCTAPNQYIMKVTKFLCHICVRPPVSKNAGSQNDVSLTPNPSMGLSELYYTAADKETVSISILDTYGKIVRTYNTDLEAGQHKLPIDIQNYSAGIYIVQWKSSTGENGSVKMIKN